MSESPYTISEILDLPDGSPIPYVEGKLAKLYPGKMNTHGSLQNGELEDADGQVMKITFADVEQSVNARGLFISLQCVEGRHGQTGVKVKDDAQYGRAIWVTSSARIEYPNGAPQGASGQRAQPPARRPQAQPRQTSGRQQQGQQQPPPNRGGGNAPLPNRQQSQAPAARQETQFEAIDRMISCYNYLHSLVNEKLQMPEGLTPFERADLLTRSTATLFVDVAKAGIVANWNPKAKSKQFPPPPNDPREWAECFIDSEGSALHGKRLSEISGDDLVKLFNYYDQKKSNTPLAECVYEAARERGVFNQPEPEPQVEEDDVPF